ncbi:zinc-ribbon domain-containing protein [Butyrivibrio fibrisolvens DSM 3071]|uniref:Zinc-ribbon domain-containing protein n=1 Tax=Butyrivibrio fibrisolvens DSM 3071 TaxID=1121131 RepID=A0A1M5WLB4_BUTFI|nr:zinc ribbon domain-containing protein [Butyrivibrio fibrisolvens]SHH88331.1 zinc-ribbon domain-containing protein [Butyrivibrio fibrisolvens DSM 3071]
MVCPKCGAELYNNDKFCTECGYKINIEENVKSEITNSTSPINTEKVNQVRKQKSAVGDCLKFIGYIDMFLCFIAGVVCFLFGGLDNTLIGLALIASGFALGMSFIGFGEIILILQDIRDKI